MLPFIFVLLWQLTTRTLGTEYAYDFIIHAKEIEEPIARLSMSQATIEQAQNARTAGQVALSSVNLPCIKQLLAYHQNPSAFVFPTRLLGIKYDEKIIKEKGADSIIEAFRACKSVISFLRKSAPQDISDEDYAKSSVKLKEISDAPSQPALQLYVKSNGYARMQFAINALQQYYDKTTQKTEQQQWAAHLRQRERWADQEFEREQQEFAAALAEQEEEDRAQWRAKQKRAAERRAADVLATEQQEFVDELAREEEEQRKQRWRAYLTKRRQYATQELQREQQEFAAELDRQALEEARVVVDTYKLVPDLVLEQFPEAFAKQEAAKATISRLEAQLKGRDRRNN